MSDDKGDGKDEEDEAQWSEVKRFRNRLSSKKTRDKEKSLIETLDKEQQQLHLSNTALQFQNGHLREAIQTIKRKQQMSLGNGETTTNMLVPSFESENHQEPVRNSALTHQAKGASPSSSLPLLGYPPQAPQGNWSQPAGIPNPSAPSTAQEQTFQQVAQIIANSMQAQQMLHQLMPPPPPPNANHLHQLPPNPTHISSPSLNQGILHLANATLNLLGAQQPSLGSLATIAHVNNQDSNTRQGYQRAPSALSHQTNSDVQEESRKRPRWT